MNYEKLFSDMRLKYKLEKEKADQQKARGKHDYNIFTTFFKAYDEVRLHSRFIASMLDPSGDHYKGRLFLDIFVAVCDIAEFGLDATSATVWTEDSHIDIHIFDNQKHIIIENKVYAKDQDRQIQRYVNTLLEDKGIKHENIYVLYLHPDDKTPSEYSLGDYEYDKDKEVLKNKHNNEIKIKPISYDKEIREWVQKCKQEVANLSDLSSFLSQYESVIDMIYGKYERVDKMSNDSLKEVFKSNYKEVKNIFENYNKTREEIMKNFFNEVHSYLENNLKENKDYEIKTWDRHIALRIKSKKWTYFDFVIEFQKPGNWLMPFMGFKRTNNEINAAEYKIQGKLLSELQKEYENQTEWFVVYKRLQDDVCEAIVQGLNSEKLAQDIAEIVQRVEAISENKF